MPATVLGAVAGRSLDSIERRAPQPGDVAVQLGQHILLTAYSTVLVLLVALPLGVALSRRRFRRVRGAVVAVSGFAQALPSFGVVLLLGFWEFGMRSAVLGPAPASLLPVLANTVVGLDQVDRSLVEAALGPHRVTSARRRRPGAVVVGEPVTSGALRSSGSRSGPG